MKGLTKAVRRIPSPVPEINHPLGKNWNNPNIDNLQFFEEVLGGRMFVNISGDEMKKMSRYDFSQPSGVYDGKMWLRGPFVSWFAPCKGDPNSCSTISAKIITQAEYDKKNAHLFKVTE